MIYNIYTSQWPFYCLTFKCDLDLQLTWTNLSNEKMFQIILKSMHKCRSYGQYKLNLWPLYYNLTFKWDLDLQLTLTNVSNGTSTPQGEQLCQIILKFMHKCTCYILDIWPSSVNLTFNLPEQMFHWHFYFSRKQLCQMILKFMHKCTIYGPEKLSLWPFHHWTFNCDLDLQPTWTNVSVCTYTPQGQQLCHIILKSIHKCTSYGPDKSGRTHAPTTHAYTPNWSCNNYVSLTASGLYKTVDKPVHVYMMATLAHNINLTKISNEDVMNSCLFSLDDVALWHRVYS